MRDRILSILSLSLAITFGGLGCSEEAGYEQKTEITGPEGTTTITKETSVETTGDNPPAVVPAPSAPETPNP